MTRFIVSVCFDDIVCTSMIYSKAWPTLAQQTVLDFVMDGSLREQAMPSALRGSEALNIRHRAFPRFLIGKRIIRKNLFAPEGGPSA